LLGALHLLILPLLVEQTNEPARASTVLYFITTLFTHHRLWFVTKREPS
jgi:hypothetical protein